MRDLEELFDLIVDKLETLPLILATRFGPWLTPLVPAYFVHQAMIKHLDTPVIWAWIAAIALEIVGIAAIWSLLRAHQWNREKLKSDPAAPIWWNIITASTYYVTAFLLVLLVEFFPNMTRFAPAAFVILSGTSAGVLALIGDQRRREREKAAKNTKSNPQNHPQNTAGQSETPAQIGQNAGNSRPPVRVPKREWREIARHILRDDPDISGAELGRRLGASERTGQNIINELNHNGSGPNGSGPK